MMVGAILNGGSSRRMGADKAALEYRGTTFLERAVENLAAVVDRIMVVGGRVAPDGTSLVPDLHDGGGPMVGLVSALRHAAGDDVLCLAVDLPLVRVATLRRIALPEPLPGQARVARTPGRLHPLCGAYAHDLADAARDHLDTGDRSVRGFVQSVPHLTLIDVPTDEMANVNTRADLESLPRSGRASSSDAHRA